MGAATPPLPRRGVRLYPWLRPLMKSREASLLSPYPLNRNLIQHDIGDGTIAGLPCLCLSDRSHDIHSLDNLSKHRVLAVQVRRGSQRDEELAAIRIRSRIGHRENAFSVVLQLWMNFIREPIARTPHSRSRGIAALNHESIDHPVEDDPIVERFSPNGLPGSRILPFLRSIR